MNNKLIIWDWNGTLLNDVEVCVKAMNIMLLRRGMSDLSMEKYKEIFTFPVKKYYDILGFDFDQESFEELSVEYINLYKTLSLNSPLQKFSIDVLDFFKARKYQQIIISASEQLALIKQVKERGIFYYFNAIIGLDNIYAKSKLQNAKDFIAGTDYKLDQILLIGDTFHDYEVALLIGCNCILVNNGHQHLKKINGEYEIIESLDDLKKLFSIRQKVE